MRQTRAWAFAQGDKQTAAFVGPGFRQTTWLVFDIPQQAQPTKICAQPSRGFGSRLPPPIDRPIRCVGAQPQLLVRDGGWLFSGSEPAWVGTFEIGILKVEEVPASVASRTQQITPQGRFIGLRYSVKNDTNRRLVPGSIADWRLTDGSRVWNSEWSTAAAPGPSASPVTLASSRGDSTEVDYVEAGARGVTWALFEIPQDAKPAGFSLYFVEKDRYECLMGPP